jgi:hypothetical protein
VNAALVEITGESIQLAMQVAAIPEKGVVEILAPQGSNQPLDERMRSSASSFGALFRDR